MVLALLNSEYSRRYHNPGFLAILGRERDQYLDGVVGVNFRSPPGGRKTQPLVLNSLMAIAILDYEIIHVMIKRGASSLQHPAEFSVIPATVASRA
jgi:hypothetical protein